MVCSVKLIHINTKNTNIKEREYEILINLFIRKYLNQSKYKEIIYKLN
jgi:hypothetical protein